MHQHYCKIAFKSFFLQTNYAVWERSYLCLYLHEHTCFLLEDHYVLRRPEIDSAGRVAARQDQLGWVKGVQGRNGPLHIRVRQPAHRGPFGCREEVNPPRSLHRTVPETLLGARLPDSFERSQPPASVVVVPDLEPRLRLCEIGGCLEIPDPQPIVFARRQQLVARDGRPVRRRHRFAVRQACEDLFFWDPLCRSACGHPTLPPSNRLTTWRAGAAWLDSSARAQSFSRATTSPERQCFDAHPLSKTLLGLRFATCRRSSPRTATLPMGPHRWTSLYM